MEQVEKQETQIQKPKKETKEEREQREIQLQNEYVKQKYEKRGQHKQEQDKQQETPKIWNVQEDQYKEKIRQEIGNNLNGKPKMPVIFFKWTEEHEKKANSVIQQDEQVQEEENYNKFEDTAHKQWDKFYKNHKLGFFHHRYYLRNEFPELTSIKQENRQNQTYILTELGCGVGDTIFPLKIEYPNLNLQASDFSAKAVEWVKRSSEFDPERVKAEVMDLVKDDFPKEFEPSDLVTLIFCLSAISPENQQNVIKKIYDWMKPGSVIYFRDYGRYDFSQLNFSRKKGRKLKDNFYVKHDGTRVYYATEQEIRNYFLNAGFKERECKAHYRYLENRKTGLEMYRVWIQARFEKPAENPIFDYYGPIHFEEHDLTEKKKEMEVQKQQFQQDQKNQSEKEISIQESQKQQIEKNEQLNQKEGKLDQKLIDKLEQKLQKNDKLLEEQINENASNNGNSESQNQQKDQN